MKQAWMKQHMKVKHPTETADDFSKITQGIISGLELLEPYFSLEVLNLKYTSNDTIFQVSN